MNEKFLILERSVRADLAIGHLYESLGTPDLAASEPRRG
jgi:hypothetical protein